MIELITHRGYEYFVYIKEFTGADLGYILYHTYSKWFDLFKNVI